MAQLKRVTMQDIADACGLSRNTVSKIFNGRGSVPVSTKELVMTKAQELGYFQLADAEQPAAPAAPNKNIALFTHNKLLNHSFGALFITNFTDRICRSGYNLKIFDVSMEDYANLTLPSHFVPSEISGIVVIELFDREYIQMLCGLGLPMLLVDSYPHAPGDLMQCDLLCMENYASTIAMTDRLIEAGATRIGFVGDYNHCSSFWERWDGFRSALSTAGLPLDTAMCILDDDSTPYGEVDWALERLQAMPRLPDAFVCANDFIAIRIMLALQRMGLSVPHDIMITGFDGSPEGEVVSPALTTTKIPSAEIGRLAADFLLQRISSPEMPYLCTYVKTTPVWRGSTRNK